MDRAPGAVELRRRLCTELHELQTIARPDQLTLPELCTLLDIMRPAAQRIRARQGAMAVEIDRRTTLPPPGTT